jgi:hypothetical protein
MKHLEIRVTFTSNGIQLEYTATYCTFVYPSRTTRIILLVAQQCDLTCIIGALLSLFFIFFLFLSPLPALTLRRPPPAPRHAVATTFSSQTSRILPSTSLCRRLAASAQGGAAAAT